MKTTSKSVATGVAAIAVLTAGGVATAAPASTIAPVPAIGDAASGMMQVGPGGWQHSSGWMYERTGHRAGDWATMHGGTERMQEHHHEMLERDPERQQRHEQLTDRDPQMRQHRTNSTARADRGADADRRGRTGPDVR